MKNMLHKLQVIVNSEVESDTNKVIACYLLENMRKLESITINELAEKCYTSNSTISRFTKSIGFNNFIELRESLTSYKDYGYELSTESLEGLAFDFKNDQQILSSYIDSTCEALRGLESIDFNEMDILNEWIHETKDVIVFGMQITGVLLRHYQMLMMSMGKVIQCCENTTSHLAVSDKATNQSLAIIYSSDGNYINGNKQIIFNLKKKGVKLVLITQNPTCKFLTLFDKIIFMGPYTNSKGGRYKLMMLLEIMVNRYSQRYFN